ncbi:RNA 2',3'-cyclic phosphodiesterase [Pseudodesulfovibrio senegalensis]|uniref:RNA 2',3'-cyclic phosphodiesterase n=1 Tax=Pseudodesulfovibrio senegalensis TaxID=1721087 RepID=A0A6N6N370_9BACT|nr:RNA 2',3'-cyclic phosphodiesterase [Pseudodesulfovibrio senegalensis]KAB1441882.1 RNA 2',3'-cyclic phosphodiesterase [Pseudodesulfovibrio senegalensis]
MGDESVRLFVGVPVPETWQGRMARLQERLRPNLRSRVTWVRPEIAHLTVRFLGNVESAHVDAVRAALESVAFEPFTLCAGDPGFFVSRRNLRTFWLGMSCGRREFGVLGRAVSTALEPLGFALPGGRLTPHVTVGRVRRDEGDDWEALRAMVHTDDWEPFTVDGFVLWQSDLGQDGPTYTPLVNVEAGKGGQAHGRL